MDTESRVDSIGGRVIRVERPTKRPKAKILRLYGAGRLALFRSKRVISSASARGSSFVVM